MRRGAIAVLTVAIAGVGLAIQAKALPSQFQGRARLQSEAECYHRNLGPDQVEQCIRNTQMEHARAFANVPSPHPTYVPPAVPPMATKMGEYEDPRLGNGYKEPLFPGYHFANWWQGVVAGSGYQLLAGATASDQTQGVVLLIRSSPSGAFRYDQVFVTAPSRDGSLRVVSVDNGMATLMTSNGSGLTFDISQRKFL